MTESPYGQPDGPRRPRSAKPAPGWVRLGLFGIRTRAQAMVWLVASVVGAAMIGTLMALLVARGLHAGLVVSVALGLVCAAFFSLATLWYWRAIQWMDANDGWSGR